MGKMMKLAALPLLMSATLASTPVVAGGSPAFIGEITSTGANFCPFDYAEANGALLPISENDALFALIGTTYGGDGQNTFALPDLRGRMSVGQGQGPGLVAKVLGETYGAESTTLTINTMPAHTHTTTLKAHAALGNSIETVRSRFAQAPTNKFSTAPADVSMAAGDVTLAASAGGSNPIPIRQPYLGMRYCIAIIGIFPSRP